MKQLKQYELILFFASYILSIILLYFLKDWFIYYYVTLLHYLKIETPEKIITKIANWSFVWELCAIFLAIIYSTPINIQERGKCSILALIALFIAIYLFVQSPFLNPMKRLIGYIIILILFTIIDGIKYYNINHRKTREPSELIDYTVTFLGIDIPFLLALIILGMFINYTYNSIHVIDEKSLDIFLSGVYALKVILYVSIFCFLNQFIKYERCKYSKK